MFNNKLKKRIKFLEETVAKIAEQIGCWAHFYEDGDGDVGDGMNINHNQIKIVDAVKAITAHLNLCIGVKASEKQKKEK